MRERGERKGSGLPRLQGSGVPDIDPMSALCDTGRQVAGCQTEAGLLGVRSLGGQGEPLRQVHPVLPKARAMANRMLGVRRPGKSKDHVEKLCVREGPAMRKVRQPLTPHRLNEFTFCWVCGDFDPSGGCPGEEHGRRKEAHRLVKEREELSTKIARIDARLRELDGRATAGNPSLRKGEP